MTHIHFINLGEGVQIKVLRYGGGAETAGGKNVGEVMLVALNFSYLLLIAPNYT